MPPRESAVVAGAAGGFGRLFSKLLADAGFEVVGVDLEPEPSGSGLAAFLRSDATQPDAALRERARQIACLVLCLPEQAALTAIELLGPGLRPDALLVDTLSVKTPVVAAIQAARPRAEALSLSPLFGPDLGLAGGNVAAVSVYGGPRSDAFLELLRSHGACVSIVTAAEHDRHAAATQVATHAALLAFGICLERLDYAPDPALATPLHRALLSLLARVVAHDPEVYRRIQCDNPYGDEARALLAQALAELDERIAGQPAFEELFAMLGRLIEPVQVESLERAERMLR